MFLRQRTQRTLQCELEPRARKNCACDCVRGEVYCLHLLSLTRESPFLVSETPCKKVQITGSPPTLRMSPRIVILSMPMKKRKVNLTMFANSTAVLLDDFLEMASVESGSLAVSEGCLVVQLGVASSLWLSRPLSSLPFCPSVRQVPGR